MKKAILFMSLMLGHLVAQAQFDATSAKSHVILKFSPLAMYDIDNAFQFGVEVPIGAGQFTVQQEIGYGNATFSLWYSGQSSRPAKDIWKSRTQLRSYYFERRRVRGYVAAEFLYKAVLYDRNQWVGVDCLTPGNCGFYQNQDIRIGRFVGAGHAKLGWQFYFSNRMSLDLFTGLGFRNIDVRTVTKGVEKAGIINRDDYFFENNSPGYHNFIPSLSLGFHLGLILGKSPGD